MNSLWKMFFFKKKFFETSLLMWRTNNRKAPTQISASRLEDTAFQANSC